MQTARSPLRVRPRGPGGPCRGPGSSRVLDALPCYLSLILKMILMQNWILKKYTVDQNLEGARACCAPAWIRHCGNTCLTCWVIRDQQI